MSRTLFTSLCDVADDLQRLTREVQPEGVQYALEALRERLDLLIDHTVGLAGVRYEAGEGRLDVAPITDQTQAIILLVGTILQHGMPSDLDAFQLLLQGFAEFITERPQAGTSEEEDV